MREMCARNEMEQTMLATHETHERPVFFFLLRRSLVGLAWPKKKMFKKFCKQKREPRANYHLHCPLGPPTKKSKNEINTKNVSQSKSRSKGRRLMCSVVSGVTQSVVHVGSPKVKLKKRGKNRQRSSYKETIELRFKYLFFFFF